MIFIHKCDNMINFILVREWGNTQYESRKLELMHYSRHRFNMMNYAYKYQGVKYRKITISLDKWIYDDLLSSNEADIFSSVKLPLT